MPRLPIASRHRHNTHHRRHSLGAISWRWFGINMKHLSKPTEAGSRARASARRSRKRAAAAYVKPATSPETNEDFNPNSKTRSPSLSAALTMDRLTAR
jgi:hypothetical protein